MRYLSTQLRCCHVGLTSLERTVAMMLMLTRLSATGRLTSLFASRFDLIGHRTRAKFGTFSPPFPPVSRRRFFPRRAGFFVWSGVATFQCHRNTPTLLTRLGNPHLLSGADPSSSKKSNWLKTNVGIPFGRQFWSDQRQTKIPSNTNCNDYT